MQFRILTTAIFILMWSGLWAQSTNTVLRPVVPPSPNAASLGKYGEVPVSMYTGVPDISIPVYEINSGRIKIPITLSYHAGGIRVEESASWVGLGWSLQAGGAITRTLRGRPDDDAATVPGGYFNYNNAMTVNRLVQGPGMSPTVDSFRWYNQRLYDATNRTADGEPDLFQLSVPGLSCKFYYNQDQKKFYTVPASKISISFTGDALSGLDWQIVDQNGLIYHFTDIETTNVSWDSRINTNLATSWFLTSIEDPLTHRNVTFAYTLPASTTEYINGISEVGYFPIPYSGAVPSTTLILQSSQLRQLRLNKIVFDQGEVDFTVQNATRLDMPEDKALGEIAVKNYLGQIIKKCELNTSYFEGGGMTIPYPNGTPVAAMYKYRLKLDAVHFKNAAGTQKYSYRFDYNPLMANRLSLDQDRWGFYNQANNTHLLDDEYRTLGNQLVHLVGGNRDVNPGVNQMGMLQRITYPTGGYTDFEYESNFYSLPGTPGSVSHEIKDWAFYVYPSENVEWVQGLAHTYAEIPFTINGPNPCGGGTAGVVWGEVVNLNPLAGDCPSQNMSVSLTVKGTDAGNLNVEYSMAGFGNPHMLPAGNYKAILDITHCDPDYFSMAKGLIHITDCMEIENGPTGFSNHLVGGLRIKSITSYDNPGNIASKKTYDYSDGITDGYSSGSIPSTIQNNYPITRYEGKDQSGDEIINSYYKRQSYSCIPLATTKGSYIGYSRVKETAWDGNTANGYTVYAYTTTGDYPDISEPGNEVPFKPVTSRDYMRGELLLKEVYAIKNNSPYLLKSISNEYVNIIDTTQGSVSYGFVGADKTPGDAVWEGAPPINDVHDVPPQLGIYKELSDIILLSKTTETTYDADNPGRSLTTITDYVYSPFNFQQNKMVTYLENKPGEKKTMVTKYPQDYFKTTASASDVDMTALRNLINGNILNQPVEITAGNEKSGIKKILSAQLTSFNSVDLLEKQVDRLEISQPLVETILSDNQSGTFFKHSLIKPALEILHHDGNGNILDQRLADNVTEAYVWGYKSNYPVAKIVGKSYADAISQSGINVNVVLNESGQYTNEQIKTELNKLRTLTGCLVTTYTFNPLVGVTSETSPNGRAIYYEYDDFGRLSIIRDQDNNILKTMKYNYTGEPEN